MELSSKIIIEGPNGVGKTTISKMLADYFGTTCYSPYSGTNSLYHKWYDNPQEALNQVENILSSMPSTGVFDRYHLTPQTMVNQPLTFLKFINDGDLTVLLDAESQTLKKRLAQKSTTEDIDASGYFRSHFNRLADNWNALYIKTDNMFPNQIVDVIVERYSQIKERREFLLKEGKSKIIHQKSDRMIVTLIPTLTTYTYQKHQIINGTEILRNSIFEIFAGELVKNNISIIDYKYISENKYSSEFCFTFPFEVIVKNRATGTTLINCPGLFTKNMPFFSTVVRFDYRREHNDIAIPTDYVRNYGIDTDFLKDNSLRAFNILKTILANIGYELIDLCFIYGFDLKGNIKIVSEISPDGMRIIKNGESFDKDLFRCDYDVSKIILNWNKLLDDLRSR